MQYKLLTVPGIFNILKTKVDNLDVDMLKTVPLDLNKLSNVVSEMIVKKDIEQQAKYKRKYFREQNLWCDFVNPH